MRENSADSVEQQGGYCEALSMIQEAERLQEITLVYFGIDSGDAEPEAEPQAPSIGSGGDDEADVIAVDVCALRVQRAAQAVGKEAARLQADTERYAAELLAGAAGAKDEAASAPSAGSGVNDGYGVVLEAMEVVKEAERLQALVERLFARIADSDDADRTDDE